MPLSADNWEDIETRAATARRAEARRRSLRRRGGLGVIGLAATAAAALIAIPALTHDPARRVVVAPAGQSTTVVTPPVGTLVPGITSVPGSSGAPGGTGAAGGTGGTGSPGTTAAANPGAASLYQPLYPFRTVDEANAWQASYRANGSQPWHLDAGQTALSFTEFLGYTDVTTVFGVRNDATGAHVTVGFPNPNGQPVNSAVIHLRRFGTGADAPWEAVGTDDTADFSLTTPKYGAVATSPLAVGGAINGVDESIKVQVLQVSSPNLLGVACCTPAGSSGRPWAATVTFHGATDKVLIVAASTGGHLAGVERFTITGVRTSKGSTPGL